MPSKVSGEPKRFVREVRQDGPTEITEGQTLTVDLFNAIAHVDVTGTSKGRGFAGVMKRHGFRGLRASHGVKRMHRHPGSSGPSADPARTQKGIRKPGQMGNAQVTVRNLEVVQVDLDQQPALDQGGRAGPQRRLSHHPADKQGLDARTRRATRGRISAELDLANRKWIEPC